MAVQQSPKFEQALALQKEGKFDAARVICEEILRDEGARAEAWHLLGLIAYQTGNIEQAAEFIGKAVVLDPSNTLFHYHRGLVFQTAQNLEAAIACYDRAIAIAPDNFDALLNRGTAFAILKQFDAAIASYSAAAALRPQAGYIYFGLGQVFSERKDLQAAAANYRKAIACDPNDARTHNNLGIVLQELNAIIDAEASFRRAVEIAPMYAEAHCNLGGVVGIQERKVEAADCYRRAVALKPDFIEAHYGLGIALLSSGHAVDACSSFRKVLALRPMHEDAHSNLIFALDLMTASDTALLQAERKRWCELFAPPVADAAPFSNTRDPQRRIRVGYVSADFKKHSAALVFGVMLTNFNAAEFDVFVYSNSSDVDAITNVFRSSVTRWREIAGLSDDAVAAMIRDDAIDILVDLSGHSRGHRLRVFAKRAAPIQITAWGFNTGTGSKAIDVIFGDEIGIPAEDKRFFAEEVRYLPSTLSAWFSELPEVNALPALSATKFVFGSFNRLGKVSDETLKLWARVLVAVPESVLMIKTSELDDAPRREQVLDAFAAAGIARARIILAGKTDWYDHVAAYNRVDICLDCFPHTGGVTTLEALMMGVPVITLTWPTLVGRLSTSFLTTLDMTDWIAATPDAYVEIAVSKVRDLLALNKLRQGLRQKMRGSIIGDGKAYATAAEQEYRTLWKEWCARDNSAAMSKP